MAQLVVDNIDFVVASGVTYNLDYCDISNSDAQCVTGDIDATAASNSDEGSNTGDWDFGSGGTDALSADGLTSAAPTLDSPALGQVHILAADGLTSSVPSLDTPALGQVHILAAGGLTLSVPSLDTPALGQVHILAAGGLTLSVPTLDTPALGQVHVLSADGLTSGTPTLDSPELGTSGTDALSADGLTSGTPTLDSPALGQVHILAAVGLTSGAATLDSPELGQIHILVAVGLTSGVPTLDSPTLDADYDTAEYYGLGDDRLNWQLGVIAVGYPSTFFDKLIQLFASSPTLMQALDKNTEEVRRDHIYADYAWFREAGDLLRPFRPLIVFRDESLALTRDTQNADGSQGNLWSGVTDLLITDNAIQPGNLDPIHHKQSRQAFVNLIGLILHDINDNAAKDDNIGFNSITMKYPYTRTPTSERSELNDVWEVGFTVECGIGA